MNPDAPAAEKPSQRWTRRRILGILAFGGLCAWWGYSAVSYAVTIRPRAYSIPTGSMAPTLRSGDRVAVEANTLQPPRRGEVWVFHPSEAVFPPGTELVKRVIGLPGETISVADGKVLIDGKPLPEPYLAGPTPYAMTPVTLGPGDYFLLGDARGASNDSHLWGPVGLDRFVGRVKLRYWPPQRIGGL